MDITSMPSPVRHNGVTPCHKESSLDEFQPSPFSSQDFDDQWLYVDEVPARERANTFPRKGGSSSPIVPNNLAFGHQLSLFSTKGLSQPLLSVQIEEYNRKHDASMKLELESKEDQVYSGLLQFQYFNGEEMETKNVHVRSSDTVAELIPGLLSTFLLHFGEDQSDTNSDNAQQNHSYVALVQGEMERELDMTEKPLEIALDCSSKGLASPKFLFKSPLSEQTDTPSTPHHTNRFTSYLGSLALPSGSSENEESPLAARHTKTFRNEFDQTSMNSFGSALSISSSKSSKTKSTSSLVTKSNKKKKLSHTLSNQETGSNISSGISPNSSPVHHRSQLQIDSPGSRRKQSRPKSIMSNFITRSLRVRKKSKQSTSTPTSDSPDLVDGTVLQKTSDELTQVSNLVSPLPVERRFTMSTVMHIYYMKPKQIQLYKSVLVSEKATTREVISQALERYNMKLCNPDDFSLYEVIGKWQDITSTLPTNMSFQASTSTNGATASLPGMGLHNTSPLVHRRTAVEEFVVCYSRKLDPNESPYSVQFFLDTKESYTRRFELRPKPRANLGATDSDGNRKGSTASAIVERNQESPSVQQRSVSVAQINYTPEASPCIFGQTTHRKRARRNRITTPSTATNDKDDEGPINFKITEDQSRGEVIDSDNSGSPGSTRHEIKILKSVPETRNTDIPVDIPILACSSPDSGLDIHKDQSQHVTSTKSPPQSTSTSTAASTSISTKQMASLDTPFLLSLRIYDPRREALVHLLTRDTTTFVSQLAQTGSFTAATADASMIALCHPDLEEAVSVCSICRQTVKKTNSNKLSTDCGYSITTFNESARVLLNGKHIDNTVTLKHGDIIAIGGCYMFIFQDYTSLTDNCIPNYNWEPCPLDSLTQKATNQADSKAHSSSHVREDSISSSSTNNEPSGKLKIKPLFHSRQESKSHSRSGSEISLTVEDVESHTITNIDLSKLDVTESNANTTTYGKHHTHKSKKEAFTEGAVGRNAHTRLIMRQVFQTQSQDCDDDELVLSMPTNSEVFEPNKPSDVSVFSSPILSKKQLKHSSSLPAHSPPRKMMFSFSLNEEDRLLTLLIDQFKSEKVECSLAPSYVLSMCVEYGIMCFGPRAMTRFVKKATSHIQSVAWESCKQLSEWQIDTEMAQQPLTIIKELFSNLEPVLLWLANTLEFYHFLSTNCGSLNLSEPDSPPQRNGHFDDLEQEDTNEDTLSKLYNVLVYIFQQAFYSVSKVLYYSLPVMLDGCTEDRLTTDGEQPIVVDQAVDFLQALLDLLTRLNIHLEVISQFYANIFFFTNAVMFNALIEQGGDMGLYQHISGQALRANLNLLEGWACQVGFRDNVLHYLAKFSGAVDLLATPPKQLLEFDWTKLRKEYPVLHPAQLHFIISQYLLPVAQVPSHWTPSKEDAIHALKAGPDALEESFDHHPTFELPSTGYTLDLTKPPQDMDHFQPYLDSLKKQLKTPKRSIDIVPVIESRPLPTYVSSTSPRHTHKPQDVKPQKVRTLLIDDTSIRARRNIGSNTESQEDLLEDTRNNRNYKHTFKYDDQEDNSVTDSPRKSYFQSVNGVDKPTRTQSSKNGMRSSGREQVVDRVHSIIAPRSFKTPEKFLLEPDDSEASTASWLKTNFPSNAEIATIARGDKGFGLIMVEGKEPGSSDTAIFIQGVIPGSTAEKCALVNSGDRILAIDGQLLDGADYIIADKYLREAEDDVSLVIARSPRTT